MKSLGMPLVTVLLLLIAGVAPAKSLKAEGQTISVNQLAEKPAAFLGPVVLVGRVAAVHPGKGLTLVDKVLCAHCAGECLTDPSTRKIPVAWSGAAPAVGALVRIRGTLEKTKQGYVLTGIEVIKE